jgi:hypothetical protein
MSMNPHEQPPDQGQPHIPAVGATPDSTFHSAPVEPPFSQPGFSTTELPTQQASPVTPPEVPYRKSWQSRLLGVSFAIFAFEIGLFLIIFPWMGDVWDLNYFQSGFLLHNFWDEPYFRGAVSGVGFINIYIALRQVGQLLRRPA